MQILYNAQIRAHYFDLCSGASNLRSLQATYLKFAEYVDNGINYLCKIQEWTMDILGARKWKRNFFFLSKKDFSNLYFIVVLQYLQL